MISYKKPPGGELIAEPQVTGVVQVRRSVVFLGAGALVIMLLLVLWYVAQRPKSEPPAVGAQYRAADVSALDRDYAKRSNAVPAPVVGRARQVTQGEIDPCVIAPMSAQCSALVAQGMRHSRGTAGVANQSSANAGAAAQAQSEAAEAARQREVGS